jgi:hypothetical protein
MPASEGKAGRDGDALRRKRVNQLAQRGVLAAHRGPVAAADVFEITGKDCALLHLGLLYDLKRDRELSREEQELWGCWYISFPGVQADHGP